MLKSVEWPELRTVVINVIFNFLFRWFCSDPVTEEEIEQDIIKSVDDEVKEKASFAPLPTGHVDDVVQDASDKFQRLNLFFEQDRVS